MSRVGSIGARLYRGELSFDFVGKRRRWYAISGLILIVAVLSLSIFRLNLGIEFKGGAEFRFTSPKASIADVRDTVVGAGVTGEPIVQRIGSDTYRVATEKLSATESDKVQQAIADKYGIQRNDVSRQFIGASWGSDISKKALKGLIVFMVLVVIVLALLFEWKMASAAIVALIHDLVITIGIYSLVGFEVTPATVIGLLTILGYSLYDTVVVFDKVRENTAGIAGGSRMTYSEAANLALNQTLVRSINTSVTALIPVGAILFVGAFLLGAGTLKDLALALFVGMLAGTYSSIFIAVPFLATLKEREPAMQALARRVAQRRSKEAATVAPAAEVADQVRAATKRTAAAATTDDETAEPVPAGTAARRPAGRPSGSGRPQPKRNKSRPGGKKRR
jgi:preprotein translocase subunit SecF